MRSICPISNTLDIVGDKWSLLVMRDILFFGKDQYGDFLASPEGISTNILAERLKRLEESDLISRSPYQTNPTRYRYEATAKGKTLRPVLNAMIKWGLNNLSGTSIPTPEELRDIRTNPKKP